MGAWLHGYVIIFTRAPRKIRVLRGQTSETHCGIRSGWSPRRGRSQFFEPPTRHLDFCFKANIANSPKIRSARSAERSRSEAGRNYSIDRLPPLPSSASGCWDGISKFNTTLVSKQDNNLIRGLSVTKWMSQFCFKAFNPNGHIFNKIAECQLTNLFQIVAT